MSFVKKAVKKVFKFVKRLVKNKIFQVVAIIALSVFTCGLAAGGFAAFGAASAAAGGGITGFFSAVGATMATGASVITGALGMTGTSATLAGHGGAMATAAGLTGAPAAAVGLGGVAAAEAAATLAPVASTGVSVGTGLGQVGSIAAAQEAAILGTAGTATTASSGFMGSMGKLMSKKVMGDVSVGQLATSAIVGGFKNKLAQDARNKEMPNGYVAGDVARGGGSSTESWSITGGGPKPEIGEEALASNTQADIGESEGAQTLAGQMAQAPPATEGQPQQQFTQGIADRLAMRDEQQQPAMQEAQDTGPGKVTMEPRNQGLVPDAPFQDEATRIAYEPNNRGLIRGV